MPRSTMALLLERTPYHSRACGSCVLQVSDEAISALQVAFQPKHITIQDKKLAKETGMSKKELVAFAARKHGGAGPTAESEPAADQHTSSQDAPHDGGGDDADSDAVDSIAEGADGKQTKKRKRSTKQGAGKQTFERSAQEILSEIGLGAEPNTGKKQKAAKKRGKQRTATTIPVEPAVITMAETEAPLVPDLTQLSRKEKQQERKRARRQQLKTAQQERRAAAQADGTTPGKAAKTPVKTAVQPVEADIEHDESGGETDSSAEFWQSKKAHSDTIAAARKRVYRQNKSRRRKAKRRQNDEEAGDPMIAQDMAEFGFLE